MMFRFVILSLASLALALGVYSGAHAQPLVAFSFDDGFNATGNNQAAIHYNNSVLNTLRKHGIKAILFPLGVLADNPDTMALVRAWGEQGHAIGNHSYSHNALSATDTHSYLDDLKRAENLLKHVPGWCLRLRFPYLDEGKTPAQHAEMLRWLAQEGYGVASATISVPDWELTKHYELLLKNADTKGAKAFLNSYVGQVIEQAQTQEKHWQTVLKRSPAHVVLLHTNPLNADALPSIIETLKRNGWRIIDPGTAFTDPIYQRVLVPESAAGPAVMLPVPNC